LAREQVEQLVQSKPAIKTLSLNQISQTDAKVWQFALSPDEDARAITRRMQADGVKELIVLTQTSRANNTARFRDAMTRLWGNKLLDKPQVPRQLEAYQGMLLLGDAKWLDQLKRLPSDRIYTIPLGVEENASLPNGLQFCDLPALYKADWPELINAYQHKPVAMPYQRLLAFGADAWQIARVILDNQPSHTFDGRTGQLKIVSNVIERRPACMRVESNGLKFY
jgi:outer membrane PBP1 activator LpoA protein